MASNSAISTTETMRAAAERNAFIHAEVRSADLDARIEHARRIDARSYLATPQQAQPVTKLEQQLVSMSSSSIMMNHGKPSASPPSVDEVEYGSLSALIEFQDDIDVVEVKVQKQNESLSRVLCLLVTVAVAISLYSLLVAFSQVRARGRTAPLSRRRRNGGVERSSFRTHTLCPRRVTNIPTPNEASIRR